MIDMNQLVAQWNTEFMYLVPFLKNTLESGLAYEMLKKTFERIPLVNRIIPAKNIAVPCLEGIVINTDNEILQNNFIAMLENSMDKTKQDICHPAFPKILGQLSMDEIIAIYLCKDKKIPITSIEVEKKGRSQPKSLKAIESVFLKYITNTDIWLIVERLIFQNLLITTMPDQIDNSTNVQNVRLTEFGGLFLKACLNKISEELIKDIINKEAKCNHT